MCKDCGCTIAGEMHRHKRDDHSPLKARLITVEESIFLKNQKLAEHNRSHFQQMGAKVWNVMSSPGAGKTTLLCQILPLVQKNHPLLVVVGDQETNLDADRLAHAGLPSIQINTHSACHLDAQRIHSTVFSDDKKYDWLFIENVGNLVCPAAFDLGENFKIALISVTEGEEKPLKYPVVFQDADLILVTKCDLLPYLDYNKELLVNNLRQQNSKAPIVFYSAKDQHGQGELIDALERIACATPSL